MHFFFGWHTYTTGTKHHKSAGGEPAESPLVERPASIGVGSQHWKDALLGYRAVNIPAAQQGIFRVGEGGEGVKLAQ